MDPPPTYNDHQNTGYFISGFGKKKKRILFIVLPSCANSSSGLQVTTQNRALLFPDPQTHVNKGEDTVMEATGSAELICITQPILTKTNSKTSKLACILDSKNNSDNKAYLRRAYKENELFSWLRKIFLLLQFDLNPYTLPSP